MINNDYLVGSYRCEHPEKRYPTIPFDTHNANNNGKITSIQSAAPQEGFISGHQSSATPIILLPNTASSSVNCTIKGRHIGRGHASCRFLTACPLSEKHTSHRVPPSVTSQDPQKGGSIKEEKETKQEANKEHEARPAGRCHLLTKILLIKDPAHARDQVVKVSHLVRQPPVPCRGRQVGDAVYPLKPRQ